MPGVWLDSIFSPVRQVVNATLGTNYSNATSNYTTILSQSVTVGRFSQPGNTTRLSCHAVIAFESTAGGRFGLTLNGATVEVEATPSGGGGGTLTGVVQRQYGETNGTGLGDWFPTNNSTNETSLGRIPVAATVTSAWLVPDGDVVANDTDYLYLDFYRYNSSGGGSGFLGNISTKVTGGTGNLSKFNTYTATGGLVTSVLAGGLISVLASKEGAGVDTPSVTMGVTYTYTFVGSGGSSIALAVLDYSALLPLGTYTVSLTGKALSSGTISITPGSYQRTTLELIEYAT